MDRDDPIVRLVSDLRRTSSHQCGISLSNGWWVFTPLQSLEHRHQGWKLHISAIPVQAPYVLQAVANVLIERAVRWKVCQDLKRLVEISSVPSAHIQVGKFITIYPRTEEEAIELAALLHSLTAKYTGPVVPTDKRYAPGSQVYYRYGGFAQLEFYHPDTSLKTPYILTPGGEKAHDRRAAGNYCPDWVINPFPCEEQYFVSEVSKGLFGKNLTVIGALRQSAKGGVFVVKTSSGTAVLKEARLGTNPDLLGRDARDRLTNEYEILRKLAPLEIAPQPLELFDADQNRYLLMEHLTGQSLAAYVEQRNYLGDDDREQMRSICISLIQLVRTCHAAGIVLRDFTPNNVLVMRRGCKLVDLELASLMKNESKPFVGYTPGYVRCGTEKHARLTIQDDLYSLGAVLCFTLTGVPPHLVVKEAQRDHLEDVLYPFLRDSELQDLLAFSIQCLRVEHEGDVPSMTVSVPEKRVQSSMLDEFPKAYIEHEDNGSSPITLPSLIPLPIGEAFPFNWETLKANATAVADDLYQTAAWQSGDRLWPQSKLGDLFHPACFHTGTAGIAYYFCEVAQATSDTTYYAHAAKVMDWTHSTHPFRPEEDPAGLYFGYGAVPWILTLIANGLNDTRYADRAQCLAQQIARAPLRQLDITHGAAGRGLMHLELYRRLGDQEQLTYATELALRIVEQREEDPGGAITWVNQEKRLWGFAHGSAGLAYYLLLLYTHTGDTLFRSIVEKTGYSLLQAAIPTTHGQGHTWAMGPANTTTRWTHWCNGASGVGLYFLKAAKVLHNSEFERMALQAANTIRFSHPFGACCQCHGLAGEGDYLLQVGRELSRPEMEQAAWKIAHKLFALRSTQHSWWLWPEETRSHPAPDYMTGYCGVYSFLLRLFHQDMYRPFLQDCSSVHPESLLATTGGNSSCP